MAGTLVISTLSDGTNSTSSTNCIQGSAKAWVSFNGTTSPATIRAQYNISSVTKSGTGDYQVNFTNAMVDTSYTVVVSSADGVIATNTSTTSGSYTTTAFRAICLNNIETGFVDISRYSVVVFR